MARLVSSDLREIVRRYAVVVGAQLGTLPLSLLWLGMTARLLGPQRFGSYLIGIAVVQFIFRIFIGWASDTLIRFGTAEAIRSHQVTRAASTRVALLVCGGGLGIALLESGRLMLQRWGGLSVSAVHLLGALLIAMAWFDLGLSMSRTLDAIHRYAFGSWLRQLGLAAGAWCLWTGAIPRTVEAVLAIELAAYATVGTWLVLRAGARNLRLLQTEWSALVQAIRYAWSNAVTFLIGYLIDWIDLYVIGYFLGVAAVGIYQFGYSVMLLASNGLMGVLVILVPLFMRWKTEGRPQAIVAFVADVTPKLSWLWSVAMSGLIVLTPHVVQWLGGSEYRDVGACLTILWAGLAFQVLSVMTTPLFSVFDRLHHVMGFNLVMATVNIIGDLIAVPRWGIQGAAWATAFAYTVAGLTYGWFSSRRFGLRLGSSWLWPWMGWMTWGIGQLSSPLWLRVVLVCTVVGVWTAVIRFWAVRQSAVRRVHAIPRGLLRHETLLS